MGLLEDVIGGVLRPGAGSGRAAPAGRATSGGMSPMLMALMAFLAYRALSGGKGSSAGGPQAEPQPLPGDIGDVLRDARRGGASAPEVGGGGLGDILGDILGGGRPGGAAAPAPGGARTPAPSGGTGGLGDILGQILGGGSPGGAAGGTRGQSGLEELSDIVEQFDKSGQGDIARSWVGPGENKPILPGQMNAVLDSDTLAQLQAATGLDRDELLAGLAQTLPGVVDKLTPQGRLPTPQEWQRLI
jgi:uncharacterized protein YidB (DUF937 family)